MKNIDLCHPYAKKFRNTYLSYIEKEKISKQNDSYWNNVTEDNFDEQYEVKWNKKWFYIGNKIEQFYNEMGWDIQKLYANKTVEYLAADDIYYRNFVIQDIWDNLLKEQDEHKGMVKVNVLNAKADTAHHVADVFLQVVYGDSTKEQIVVPMVEVKDAWKMR